MKTGLRLPTSGAPFWVPPIIQYTPWRNIRLKDMAGYGSAFCHSWLIFKTGWQSATFADECLVFTLYRIYQATNESGEKFASQKNTEDFGLQDWKSNTRT
jgi:hypothetical protein